MRIIESINQIHQAIRGEIAEDKDDFEKDERFARARHHAGMTLLRLGIPLTASELAQISNQK